MVAENRIELLYPAMQTGRLPLPHSAQIFFHKKELI
nr:MAG TPA: hypothetical protein [Caudoviricetes sp.]